MVEAKRKGWLPFGAGLLAVLVMLVPYLILGEDVFITYHDQLDGELLAYIFQAKYLFRNTNIVEFMGGMEKTALIPPAPFFVLFFCAGHYFAAYVCMHIIGVVVGYVGMYLLAGEVSGSRVIGMVVGVLFAYLPFRPVYGLSQFGIPLLIFCLYQLWQGKRLAGSYVYIVIYTLCSSLVLVGFGVLGMLTVLILWAFMGKGQKHACEKRVGAKHAGVKCAVGKSAGMKHAGVKWLVLAECTMLLVYVLENLSLLGQLLGISGGQTSHKTEYQVDAEHVGTYWLNGFLTGGQHSEDYHFWVLLLAVPVFFVWLRYWKGRNAGMDRRMKLVLMLLGCNVVLCLLAALWNANPIATLRKYASAFRGFAFERVLWLTPSLWYLMLAGLLSVVWEACRETLGHLKNRKVRTGVVSSALLAILAVGCLGLTGIMVLLENDLKTNVRMILDPQYKMISYRDYYAEDVMHQVKAFLEEKTGKTPNQYRVVSLGIDPAAAYYSGFYCLDGYSNNYSLEYKHAFRKVLEPELEESDYLKAYFDGWGNRCYLYSSESPGYYTFEKFSSYFWNYKIDAQALADLGCEYVLSAIYLVDSDAQGLYLMREEPFWTDVSYYAIYLYQVGQDQ